MLSGEIHERCSHVTDQHKEMPQIIPLWRLRFGPRKCARLRLRISLASDDAKPSDHFAHEAPNPPVGSFTQLRAHAYQETRTARFTQE